MRTRAGVAKYNDDGEEQQRRAIYRSKCYVSKERVDEFRRSQAGRRGCNQHVLTGPLYSRPPPASMNDIGSVNGSACDDGYCSGNVDDAGP